MPPAHPSRTLAVYKFYSLGGRQLDADKMQRPVRSGASPRPPPTQENKAQETEAQEAEAQETEAQENQAP